MATARNLGEGIRDNNKSCPQCGQLLTRLPWTKGSYILTCNNSQCSLFRTPQGNSEIGKMRNVEDDMPEL